MKLLKNTFDKIHEYLYRKIVLKDYSKDEQDKIVLLKDNIITRALAAECCCFFIIFPIICVIDIFIMDEKTISNIVSFIIFITLYCSFIFWFIKAFYEQIKQFLKNISSAMYFSFYTTKGNCISKEDFNIIQNEDPTLYNMINKCECMGKCYFTCFRILKALKKGKISFWAIKRFGNDDITNKFTMHVVYINNGWCFDTFSHKQFPVNKLYEIYEAIYYADFTYDFVKEKNFSEFKEQIDDDLEKWCRKNDCYHIW